MYAAQKRERYLYIGMDLHKKTHTAVLVNCWNEKLETLVIENKPAEFEKLVRHVNKKALTMCLTPVYGLENAYGHGRSLAVYLIENGYTVKDVNPALAYDRRRSAPTMKKNDEYDAYCVAMALIDQLHILPDAKPEDNCWTLAQLVNRRDTIVNDGIRLKNGLHEQLSVPYPSYRKFFSEIDRKSALYFWKTYPSPLPLKDKTAEDLTAELKTIAANFSKSKAAVILDCVKNDGDTLRDYQSSRDFITQSLVHDLERQVFELSQVDVEIEKMLETFDYKLTTLPGVGSAIAGKLIAEIGDIRRFPNADKLASFAGIAPKHFSSAGKGRDESNKQGNRALHGLLYFLAVSMVCVPKSGKPNNPIFYDYFCRKLGEGKTKSQE
ncbi:MAG: IS110 family transposase [Clostridia bacterium]|nr:IS110 family transposase [Clostridia bacterium]